MNFKSIVGYLRQLAEEAAGYPVGTIRKWKHGSFIKTAAGDWIPYEGGGSGVKVASVRPFGPTSASMAKKSPQKAAETVKIATAVDDLTRSIKDGALSKGMSLADHIAEAKVEIGKHADSLPVFKASLTAVSPPGAVVSARVKEFHSAVGKLSRNPKYDRPSALTDLTGGRIVCRDTKDVYATIDALKKEFEVVELDDKIAQPQGSMHYRSIHALVKDKSGLVKELQIRTPNQHEWSEWCHNVYKPANVAQASALETAKETIQRYAQELSDFFFAIDSGQPPPPKPPCVEVIRVSFGCL